MVKKWWVILISTVIIGIVAFAYTAYFVEEIYVSKGMLYVNNSNSAYNIVSVNPKNDVDKNISLNDIYASARLATTSIEILKSDTFMEAINESIEANLSPAKLRSMVNISSVNETEILQVMVSNTNPQLAATIVEAILNNANDQITKVIIGSSAEIIDNANLPTFPSSPNVMKNTLIGLLLGVLLGMVISYVLYLLDDRVKGQEDLSKRYDYPVLGLIPSFRNHRKSSYYVSTGIPSEKPPVTTD